VVIVSKLFKLKEWLTMSDTARYLSISFGEDVSEADVLRLALDGRLKLSVNFVNPVVARSGKIIPINEAEYTDVPSLDGKGVVRCYDGVTLYKDGVISRVIKLDEMVRLRGIYDVPMIGADHLDLENTYQKLTSGIGISRVSLDGPFVEGTDGTVFQLQTSFEDVACYAGTSAQLKKLNQQIADNNIGVDAAEEMLRTYKVDREAFLKQIKSEPASKGYFPSDGLPDDAVLIVRTKALVEFESWISESEGEIEKPLSDSERDSLLKLVIGMAIKGYGYNPTAKKNSSVADIANDLALLGLPLGDDTVRKYLKLGNKQLPAKPTIT